MRSGKSWFNGTLFAKNLTRFWPIWALYLVIWLFLLPADLVLGGYSDPGLRFSQRHVLFTITEPGLYLAAIFGLLTAMAVWSYLCNNRSTCLMHTLPIRREGLFLTNFLSGLTFLIGPNLIILILTLLAEAMAGCVNVGALIMWFFALSLTELFFFCFATFCAMFTGHILGLPAFYAILNFLVYGVVTLVDLALSRFVFGYMGVDKLWRLAEWLTPIAKLWSVAEVRKVTETTAGITETIVGYQFVTLGYILIYAFLGLVLAGIALAVYCRRHMERSGDVVTVTWVRPVFQYGVAFCCALAFGSLFFELFRGAVPDTAWSLLVFMLICGVVGYFIARMILEKSFRVFRCWKGCLPLLAVIVVLTCVMEFDVTGFEQRVPDADRVKAVSIGSIHTRPYDEGEHVYFETEDPDVIRAVIETHQSFVDNKQDIEAHADAFGGRMQVTQWGYSVETDGYSGFNVSYQLKDGSIINRKYAYSIPVYAADQDDPGTVTGKLYALANLPQVIEEIYGFGNETAEQILEINVSSYCIEDGYDRYEDVPISEEAWADVLKAVRTDLAQGNLGRRYLMDDEERMNNCFVNDLEFVFYRPGEKEGVDTAEVTLPSAAGGSIVTERITVTLQTTARHTLAALEKAGVLTKQVNLLTHAQMELASGKWEVNGGSWEEIELKDYAWAVLGG